MLSGRQYTPYPRVGVGVLVFKDDQFLLICRGKSPGKGKWTLPGGMIELGETMEQAAVREIKEECGIEIQVNQVIKVFEHIERDAFNKVRYHYVVVDFVGEYIRGTLKAASDVDDARWFTLLSLEGMEIPERTLNLIQEVYQKKIK